MGAGRHGRRDGGRHGSARNLRPSRDQGGRGVEPHLDPLSVMTRHRDGDRVADTERSRRSDGAFERWVEVCDAHGNRVLGRPAVTVAAAGAIAITRATVAGVVATAGARGSEHRKGTDLGISCCTEGVDR